MKILFVSGVSVGGAPRSTTELARHLAARHEIVVLLGTPLEGWRGELYRRSVNLWVKSAGTSIARPVLGLLRRIGRRSRLDQRDPEVRIGGVAENAYLPLLDRFRPDVVVVNSVPRAAWRWMSQDLRQRGVTRVLYVREEHALTHLTMSNEVPDVLIANSDTHARRLREAGFECVAIPSVVDRAAATVDTSRECVLLVNPIREHRVELALAMASARPDIPFVLQESWPLDAERREELLAASQARANVELRDQVPSPAEVYRDARVLLVPYPTNRPRVVAEAQHNGIPVLAADQPALAEAVGPGGLLVGLDESADAWVAALDQLWGSAELYAQLSERARRHDARPELDPAHVARLFEEAVLSRMPS